MSSVVFRGCEFREWKGVMDDDGNVTTRIKCRADFSDPVRDAMEWEPISHGIQAANLTGLLRSRVMTMTPADKELKKHGFDLDITEVRDFKYHANMNGEGDVIEQYITFQVVSGAVGASHSVESYLRVVGRAGASLKVAYEAQQRLPGTESAAAEQPEANDEQPPLDNVLNMAGSGRERKKRTRPVVDIAGPTPEEAAALDSQIAESLQ